MQRTKLGISMALALIMSLSLLTSGSFAQSVNKSSMSQLTHSETVPNINQINANAAREIFNAQASSGITKDLVPTDMKTSFRKGDTIYVTFRTAGKQGYIQDKWYLNGGYAFSNNILAAQTGDNIGYMAGYFNKGGTAVIGLYWCTQANCSDAALAQVVTVTVA